MGHCYANANSDSTRVFKASNSFFSVEVEEGNDSLRCTFTNYRSDTIRFYLGFKAGENDSVYFHYDYNLLINDKVTGGKFATYLSVLAPNQTLYLSVSTKTELFKYIQEFNYYRFFFSCSHLGVPEGFLNLR